MAVTVISPVLNEIGFLPAWCVNVERYAGEIIVIDTGSTDGSREYLEAKGYTVLREKIPGPYLWDEGKVRNRLLDCASRSDWVFRHDCDELWGEDFFRDLPDILNTRKLFIYARQLTFAYKPWLVRERYWNPQDPMDWFRHYPVGWMPVAWKNRPYIKYRENGHNFGPIQFCNLGKLSPRLSRKKIPQWLYHYNFLNPKKTMSQRRGEMRETGVRLATYFGEHPKETKLYDWLETSH